jgi:hypothetical protein
MRPQHRQMLDTIKALSSEIIPDNMTRQEDPKGVMECSLYAALYQGMYNVPLEMNKLIEFYDETVEGFYHTINPYILLGCALEIVDKDVALSVPEDMFTFTTRLMDMFGPSITVDQFLYEVNHDVNYV